MMKRMRIQLSHHAVDEMLKASLRVKLITMDMISETMFSGFVVAQEWRHERHNMVWQANRHFGKDDLRVVFAGMPGYYLVLTILWEGHYD